MAHKEYKRFQNEATAVLK